VIILIVLLMCVRDREMAGKSRQKTAGNIVESVTLSLNERILKDCHALYTDSENGENNRTVNPETNK